MINSQHKILHRHNFHIIFFLKLLNFLQYLNSLLRKKWFVYFAQSHTCTLLLFYWLKWRLFLSEKLDDIVKLINEFFHQFSIWNSLFWRLLTWMFWTVSTIIVIVSSKKLKFHSLRFFEFLLTLLITFSYLIFFTTHHKQQLFIFVGIFFLLKFYKLINTINKSVFHIILLLP